MLDGILYGLFGGLFGPFLARWLSKYGFIYVFLSGAVVAYLGIIAKFADDVGFAGALGIMNGNWFGSVFMLITVGGGLMAVFFAFLGRLNQPINSTDKAAALRTADFLVSDKALRFRGADGVPIVTMHDLILPGASPTTSPTPLVQKTLITQTDDAERSHVIGSALSRAAADTVAGNDISVRGRAIAEEVVGVAGSRIATIGAASLTGQGHHPPNMTTGAVLYLDGFGAADVGGSPADDHILEALPRRWCCRKTIGSLADRSNISADDSPKVDSCACGMRANLALAQKCGTMRLVLNNFGGKLATKMREDELHRVNIDYSESARPALLASDRHGANPHIVGITGGRPDHLINWNGPRRQGFDWSRYQSSATGAGNMAAGDAIFIAAWLRPIWIS